MFEVQEVSPGHNAGASAVGATVPERLLEDSDGVTRLYYAGMVLGVVQGRATVVSRSAGAVYWREWSIPLLIWRRACAFKMLQGASLGQLLGPRYLVLRGSFLPFYSPLPGVRGLRLAELVDSPEQVTQRQLFELVYGPPSHS